MKSQHTKTLEYKGSGQRETLLVMCVVNLMFCV